MTTADNGSAVQALAGQRYFEDVKLGEEFEQYQQPTTDHVRAFMGETGRNWNDAGSGRFSDNQEARRQGLERPIVPGNMSTAMITRLVTDWMGPLGRIVSLDISFRRPVLHNDRLRCVALVTDSGDEVALEAGGPAIIALDVALENERGERPVQGTATVELPRRSETSI